MLLMEMKKLLGRVEWLVESLLKLSKLDAGSIPFHMERIDLEGFLREAGGTARFLLNLRDRAFSLMWKREVSWGTGHGHRRRS